MLFKKFVKRYLNNKSTKTNIVVSGGTSVISSLKILNQIKQIKKIVNVYLLDERNSKNSNLQNYFLIKRILNKNWNISKIDKNFLKKENIKNLQKKLKLSKCFLVFLKILSGTGIEIYFVIF